MRRLPYTFTAQTQTQYMAHIEVVYTIFVQYNLLLERQNLYNRTKPERQQQQQTCSTQQTKI